MTDFDARSLVISPSPESGRLTSSEAGYRVSHQNGGLKTVIHISDTAPSTPCSVPSTPTLQNYKVQNGMKSKDSNKGNTEVIKYENVLLTLIFSREKSK